MNPFFKELFEYTFTFNNKVVSALLENDTAPAKAILLINHTINSQEIWNARIENISISRDVWGIRPLEELKLQNEVNYQKVVTIIDECDFEEKVTYTNTKGQTFENSIRDILFHAVNHSTYHRGQIATDFKVNGMAPLVTDYIFYKREEL
jgi:uncharacterized damage-inducible protein DinB